MEALVVVLFDLYKQTTVICVLRYSQKSLTLAAVLLKLCIAVYTHNKIAQPQKLNRKNISWGMTPDPPAFTCFVEAWLKRFPPKQQNCVCNPEYKCDSDVS